MRITAIRIGCLAALAAGIGWNVRYTIADLLAQRHQQGNPEAGLGQALRILPVNGAYAAQLADQVYASDPQLARSLLHKATELNPYDAASWIQLGLLEEANDQRTAAEAALLRAARADSTFLPAWSLANFYFRSQNEPQFWYWARRAAQMAPGDATSLFRLAWYVRPSVPEIENRMQLQRPAVESQLVNFLIAQDDPPAVSEAALHLLGAGSSNTRPAILGACDWLLASRHPELALSLWNGLASQRRIAFPPLTPGTVNSVTNGEFARQPTSLGFDWHTASVDGVSSFLNTSPGALGFEFSGDEPDRFVVMSQTAPVIAGKKYALSSRYRSDGIAPGGGLQWTVTDARAGTMLGHTTGLSAPQGGQTVACFSVPEGSDFVNLVLGYERQPGTVRPEGKLTLTQVSLENLPFPGCSPGD